VISVIGDWCPVPIAVHGPILKSTGEIPLSMAQSLSLVDFHAIRTLLCDGVDQIAICLSCGIRAPLLMHLKTIIDDECLIERADSLDQTAVPF
jgi:hypothetical protein